jgi:hypothetical protein
VVQAGAGNGGEVRGGRVKLRASRGACARGQQGRGTGPGQGEDDAWTSFQQEVARAAAAE